MTYASYEKVVGIIRDIRSGGSCCSIVVSVDTESEIVNFVVSPDTIVVDNIRLRRGMRAGCFFMIPAFRLRRFFSATISGRTDHSA